ncbi:uncharacterized protein LOC122498603 [Leptopilina heterotoma]|uniref:uncharacterized protein LOC122498603 n=1 Tax=Leptopilina heterotoma TaxID=63436 RepID=UPI001CA9AED8|nr:uncharacterized protein LOC122498603 [Leptopilina heterotoma]
MANTIFGIIFNYILIFVITLIVPGIFARTFYDKNISNQELNNLDYNNYNLDEYQKPMQKRAALLLDRLMIALQKAIENEDSVGGGSSGKYYVKSGNQLRESTRQNIPLTDEKTMDLQRRGQAKGRVYWRCYFNAVTCFRRK